jgi:hypothetical protein
MKKLVLGFLIAAALLSLAPFTAHAEEEADLKLPNRFMLRAGYGFVFRADTSFTFNGPRGSVGGDVDYHVTLGGDREDEFWRIDASFHLTPRHEFVFSYCDVTRRGERTLARDITIGDTTFRPTPTRRASSTSGSIASTTTIPCISARRRISSGPSASTSPT